MIAPDITTDTGFAIAPLFVADEDARPCFVPVLKATYDLSGGAPVLADEQAPVDTSGSYWGEPGQSSVRIEPEHAPIKLTTDVVLIGHAVAPGGSATHVDVGLRVGPVQRVARVFGPRTWSRGRFRTGISDPEPFDRIALTYENAFGGWDRRHDDESKHDREPRNPIGRGFLAKGSKVEDGEPLPSVEDPRQLIGSPGDRPSPVGFGFVYGAWEPRASLAGTYDAAWNDSRKPLLPKDFDRRYFNAAFPDLVTPSFLEGGEPVRVVGTSTRGALEFRLPAPGRPVCRVARRRDRDAALTLVLDTIVLDTDAERLYMTWRGHLPLREGPLDVQSGEVVLAGDRAPVEAR